MGRAYLSAMPVEFLTDEATAYGRYAGMPPQGELDRMFYLDDADRRLIARRRGDHTRLGFALQLTTVRYLGTFLPDPLDVPTVVLDRLAGQLQIADPSCVKRYTERRTTPFEHREDIKAAYGLREFSEAEAKFAQWARSRAWNTGQGPKTIFADGVQWLHTNAVLLPGATTLARSWPGSGRRPLTTCTRRWQACPARTSRPPWSIWWWCLTGRGTRTWSAGARARPSGAAGTWRRR
jgi:hypothetical protein